MAERAAKNASDQRVGMVEIRRVARLAGNFFDAVNQRNARTFGEASSAPERSS